ncbi:SDR family NAD(P)-dependent oxidoreductase [Agromyces bauzanensis]|uniref:3-oxoacyl-ACP reductase n=1 Tax=Agromyces bauzanensis TaxID=1308924 RepID=A0A917PRI2_9MICO|nr:SDR family oxidoreductase [Agromyces bauzanensis]GGJ88940.1 3-oxoacyl-ACP reductase [Agromyces bauzanensis]
MTIDDPGGILAGRTAVVTGAGRGIGRATAVALARAGVATIALLARSAGQLEGTARLVEAAGARAHVRPVDLGDPTQIADVVAELTGTIGDVDILINNAATVAPLGPTATRSAASMLDAFTLNTIAPVLVTGALLPGMVARGWGRVVNVSSGIVAHPAVMIGGSTYAATKAALETQTISMAAEYADTGVTINAYRPGSVDTAMQEWIRAQDPDQVGHVLHDRFVASHASGRLLTPEASAEGLVGHLTRADNGQIWDVTDPS